MKKCIKFFTLFLLILSLTQCLVSEETDYSGDDSTQPDRNTNICMALGSSVDKSIGGFLASGSLALNADDPDARQRFQGTRTLTDGIYNWAFTLSEFNDYATTYFTTQAGNINVSIAGSFSLTCGYNSNTGVTTYNISFTAPLYITYDSTSYTLTDTDITYIENYDSDHGTTTYSISGNTTVDGTPVTINY